MDEINSNPAAWPLPSSKSTLRRSRDTTIESTVRQHLAELNQKLLIAKAELDADRFRNLLSEVEKIRFGFDGRYNTTAPIFETSAFSEDGRKNIENVENIDQCKDKKRRFTFSKVTRLLQRFLFPIPWSHGRHVGQVVADESRDIKVRNV